MHSSTVKVRLALVSTASALALLATPAFAQTVPETSQSSQSGNIETGTGGDRNGRASSSTTQSAVVGGIEEIVVTAQRQAESLQDVPIAVSAFSAEALERQQIENTSDLQLSLPNVTYTKTNFTGSNLSVRGIGQSVVSTSSDSGVGIHINDMPVVTPLLFETEFFDMERIELLRGPQGTLFGRNATGGVMNLITARPTDEFGASVSGEYGNFEAIKANGMINVPLGDWGGFRLAGQYVKRDGYTKNLFDDSRIDGRDNWAVRGTLRLNPTETTTVDLIGYYFQERSDRSRIQKQLCNHDPTGVLGCSPDRLEFEPINGNATLGSILASQQFFRIALGSSFLGAAARGQLPLATAQSLTSLFTSFGLGSVYGADAYAGVTVPTDLRTVNIDYNPRYRAHEALGMVRIEQELGDQFNLTVIGGYEESANNGRTDYNLTVANSQAANVGAATFRAVFPTAAARLFQGSNIGVSGIDRGYTGFIGGNIERFAPQSTEYDQSNGQSEQWSVEAHVDSQFDGPFNFLLGANYLDYQNDGDYYVVASPLDYSSLILGTAGSAATGGGLAQAAPFYDNESNYSLKALGLFGEVYYNFTDELKLTLGARYTKDDKDVNTRQAPLLTGPAVAFGTTSINVPYRNVDVSWERLTGRAVIDWTPETTWSDDTLVYASFSRGYKGGGVNPAVPAIFNVAETFAPETVNAFEIGTKNTFGGGTFRANLSAFYYDYKDYQVSRIVNRTSVNDNTNATVYGIEGEFLIAPAPAWLFNINASYLKTKIKDLQLVDPRDPSGGRSDVVIIKDITNASNCAVIPNATGIPRADALVNAVNAGINASTATGAVPGSGLQGVTPIPGTNTVGAYSVCAQLAAASAAAGNPYTVSDGVAVDLTGNELQNSPNYKVSVGGQHTWDFANEMSLVARVDYSFTGEYYGRNFNKAIDRIESYDIVNAQLQLNGPEDRWFLRAFVQNLTDNDAITGMYVTDQSSGLFTNIFTLEPRRYGVSAGFRF